MKRIVPAIIVLLLLSLSVQNNVTASPEAGHGILVVDSSAEVLVLDENLSFTAPAWVELPATNEGKEYFLILKIDGLEVKIPVLVKEGLTTILKVNGGKIWEAIMTEGAKPIELKFEAPLRLPPKLPGSGQHWNVQ